MIIIVTLVTRDNLFTKWASRSKGEQPVRYRTNQDRHEMIIILRRP